jgi:hypothetical protein
MARTTTKCVDFQTLQSRGPSVAVVVKLMMASSDLTPIRLSLIGERTGRPANVANYDSNAESTPHNGLVA